MVIDEIGKYRAALRAMELAVERLSVEPDEILVDGLIELPTIPSRAIVSGDDLIKEISAPRILSPRTQKAGATLFEARKIFWDKLQPYIPMMKEYGWITSEIVQLIEEMMARRAYPPTYKKEWIEQQEPLALSWSGKM